jgi:hypothetical protein
MMTPQQLAKLSDEVGPQRSLLVCCAAFRGDASAFPNLTVKKIPKAVLAKCEWGHDDYSLEIQNLPQAPKPDTPPFPLDDAPGDAAVPGSASAPKRRGRPPKSFGKPTATEPGLFDDGEA